MNTTEIIVFVGLAALIIGTQLGRRALTPRRFLIPFVAAGAVAYHYLQGIPTAGGDLDFIMLLSLAGIALGILVGCLMHVEREESTGRLVTQAGVAYAALWVLVFGGRLAFAWAATSVWQHQVMEFSIQHAITGSAAWTAAFVLMAVSMIAARAAVVAIRALMLSRPIALSSLLAR